MFLTPHTLVGLAIAKNVSNPLFVFIFALGGHFILDMIPHGDNFLYERYLKNHKDKIVMAIVAIDLLGLLTIIILNLFNLFNISLELAGVAILGSILPDLFVGIHLKLEEFFKQKKLGPKSFLQRHDYWHPFLENHYRLHDFIHRLLKTEVSFYLGITIQTAVACIALFLIFSV